MEEIDRVHELLTTYLALGLSPCPFRSGLGCYPLLRKMQSKKLTKYIDFDRLYREFLCASKMHIRIKGLIIMGKKRPVGVNAPRTHNPENDASGTLDSAKKNHNNTSPESAGKGSGNQENNESETVPSVNSHPENATPVPSVQAPADTSFASSDEEARIRFMRWKATDPFPDIDAALLNSADILAYVKATSLIYPFDEERLSGASYDVKIEGDVIYYDEASESMISIPLYEEGDSFDLRPNSIAFVTLQPMFRIPDYLALRFNLKISHIYKGLLLGTGPLVDPGFSGRLSIPLHNLTKNTYHFVKGDELITMEFTKMSTNQLWNHSATPRGHGENYKPNNIKAGRTVKEYIHKALKKDRLVSVVSSIPAAMQESKSEIKKATEAVQAAKDAADRIETRASWQAGISVVAVCALVISVAGFSITALNKANDRYDALLAEYAAMKEEYSDKMDELENQIASLENTITLILADGESADSAQETVPAVQQQES